MKTLEEVLEMAGTSIGELCIAGHMGNYTHLIVQFNDDYTDIIDSFITETTDSYYINNDFDSVLYVGTGSISCDCDGCVSGYNPKDWAGNEAYDKIDWFNEKFNDLLESKQQLLDNI